MVGVLIFTTMNLQSQNNVENIPNLVHKTHAVRTLQLAPFYNYGIRYLDSTEVFTSIEKIEHLAKEENDEELLL
jgi:hypothetical protein